MSDPLIRAEAQIRANPRERAAYELGKAEGFEDGWYAGYDEWNGAAPDVDEVPRANAAAAYLLLAETTCPACKGSRCQPSPVAFDPDDPCDACDGAGRVEAEPPTREYTTEEIRDLAEWANRVAEAAYVLKQRRIAFDRAGMARLDEAEAQVQAAARVLAGMRGNTNTRDGND